MPEDLVLFKASNSFGEGSGCFVFVQWSPPTNTQEDDVTHYIVDYSLGRTLLRSTSYEFRIPNCTVELAVNITAVSRCGSLGGNITQIVPLLPSAESALVTEGMSLQLLYRLCMYKLCLHEHAGLLMHVDRMKDQFRVVFCGALVCTVQLLPGIYYISAQTYSIIAIRPLNYILQTRTLLAASIWPRKLIFFLLYNWL